MARKLLSLVVALAVVLSSMSFAFAAADPKAVSADVTDKKVKVAVEKLVALGMVEGIDGKYVPDQKLKRSELTKLIVIALGLGPAADAAVGATQFSDVGADHWASGYITVAAGQGLVQGMGDGTFSPDTEITFAQALTILVRALGYKDEFLKGIWPGNYLAKASEKGIYSGISITPGAAVKRGDFAIMMSNTLDAKIVTVGEYKDGGVTYKESSNITLMKDKMKLDKIEVRPTANARLGSGTDKITFKTMKDYTNGDANDGTDLPESVKNDGTEYTWDIASGINTDIFLGAKTYAYYSKDTSEISYMEDAGLSEVYWDGIDKFQGSSSSSDTVNSDVKLRWSGKVFTVSEGDKAYAAADATKVATIWLTYNGELSKKWNTGTIYTNTDFAKSQDFGRFVVEGNKVVFADLYRYDQLGLMVKSVDDANKMITYIDDSGKENTLNITSNYPAGFTMYLNGGNGTVSQIALKDVKADDVVYFAKSKIDSKEFGHGFVFRKTATGTFTSVTDDGGKIELDSKSDSLIDIGDKRTYSKDNNATYDTKSVKSDLVSVFTDFIGNKVTIIYDNNKKVRHLYGESIYSSEMYGLIKEMDDPTTTSKGIRIYTPNDDSVLYYCDDTDKVTVGGGTFAALRTTFTTNTGLGKFTGIKYKINKDGKIAKNTVVAYGVDTAERYVDAAVPFDNNVITNAVAGDGSSKYVTVTGNFGDQSVTGSSDIYYIDNEVKIIDVSKSTPSGVSNLTVSKWENFKNKEISGSGTNLLLVTDPNNAKTVKAIYVLDKNIGSITVDQKGAYLINYLQEDDKTMVLLKLPGSDTTVKYELENTSKPTNIPKESAVIVNMTSAGKVTVYNSAYEANKASSKNNFQTVAGFVYKKEGSYLYINDSSLVEKYQVASDALIYSEKDKKSMSDILDGRDAVVAVVKNGSIVAMEMVDSYSFQKGQATAQGTYLGTDYKAIFMSGFNAGKYDASIDTAAEQFQGYYCTTSQLAALPGTSYAVWGGIEGKALAVTK